MRRRIVAQFHGKEKEMALMVSENAEVVDAALSACSRLLIQNWEKVEKKSCVCTKQSHLFNYAKPHACFKQAPEIPFPLFNMSSEGMEPQFLSIPEEPAVEGIVFSKFSGENEIAEFKQLNDSMLSEAYSVYTYHYFVKDIPDITYIVCFCTADSFLGPKRE